MRPSNPLINIFFFLIASFFVILMMFFLSLVFFYGWTNCFSYLALNFFNLEIPFKMAFGIPMVLSILKYFLNPNLRSFDGKTQREKIILVISIVITPYIVWFLYYLTYNLFFI